MFRTIRPAVAILAHRHYQNWDRFLGHIAYAYNTSFHRSIQSTPFYLMFGRNPLPPPAELEDNVPYSQQQNQRDWLKGRDIALQALNEEQSKQKDFYDVNRARPQNLKRGDFVLLRLPRPPNYTSAKLAPKFVGPYKIVDIFGPVVHLQAVFGRGNVLTRRIHRDRVVLCDSNYPNIHPAALLDLPFSGEVPPGLEEESPE